MKKISFKLLLGIFLGVVITLIATTTILTHQYGRLANHKHCDLSLDKLGSVEASNYVYVTYYK